MTAGPSHSEFDSNRLGIAPLSLLSNFLNYGPGYQPGSAQMFH